VYGISFTAASVSVLLQISHHGDFQLPPAILCSISAFIQLACLGVTVCNFKIGVDCDQTVRPGFSSLGLLPSTDMEDVDDSKSVLIRKKDSKAVSAKAKISNPRIVPSDQDDMSSWSRRGAPCSYKSYDSDSSPSVETPWYRAVEILNVLIREVHEETYTDRLKEVLQILNKPEKMLKGKASTTHSMDSETALWFKNALSESNEDLDIELAEKLSTNSKRNSCTSVKETLPAIRRVLENDGQLLAPVVFFQEKSSSSLATSFRADKDHTRRQLEAAQKIQQLYLEAGDQDINLTNLHTFDPEQGSGDNINMCALIIPPFPGSTFEKMQDVEAYLLNHSFVEWEFDIFEFDDICGHHSLWFIPMVVLHFYNLVGLFAIDPKKLSALLIHAEETYCFDPTKLNIYHNSLHAADVALTSFHYCNNENVGKELNGLQGFAFILAAVFHDYRHPGLNNGYLVLSQNEIAIIYNDSSVLENFHASEAYRLFNQDSFKICGALTSQELGAFRSYFIKTILATDLAHGFEYVSKFKNIAETTKDFSDFSSKILLMQMALKCADVAHPSKPWHLHEKWSSLIVEEFFAQGDQEKKQNLQISPLCDRQTNNIPKSQCDFIDFVVRPCLEPFSKFCQEKKWLSVVQQNYTEWKSRQQVTVSECIAECPPPKSRTTSRRSSVRQSV